MVMRLTTVRNTILFFIVVLVSASIGYAFGSRQLTLNKNKNSVSFVLNKNIPAKQEVDFSLFWNVWDRLERSYIDKSKLIPQQMVYGAISGMVASLDDPYTVFLPPKEQKQAKEELNGTFEGIGAELGMKDKKIIVIAPLKDMPAEAAGIKKGDWIVKVDNVETAGWSIPEAVEKIRGPKGTTVLLTVLHENGTETVDITVPRNTIIVHSVEWTKTYWQVNEGKYSKNDDCLSCQTLAYLRLSRFGDQTNDEWNKAVKEIKNELNKGTIKGVVLDLRNNPGGYLQGAVFIASEFLKQGLVVVQQEYNTGKKETYSVVREGELLNIPLVVLINNGSASASEIVAGALRDYDRAKLVGEKTFGKGSIQEAQDLKDGAGLHITIAKWLLPKGDWINSKGVTPTFNVGLDNKEATTDTQLQEAANLILI